MFCLRYSEFANHWNNTNPIGRQAILRKLTDGPLGILGERFYDNNSVNEISQLKIADHSAHASMNGTEAENLWIRVNSGPVGLFAELGISWVLFFIP